jgi:hypothetical protein
MGDSARIVPYHSRRQLFANAATATPFVRPAETAQTARASKTIDAIEKVASDRGTKVRITGGQGEFIGTTLESGSDAEQRADARRVSEETIRQVSDSDDVGGRDVAQLWDEVRNYWKSISEGKSLESEASRLAKSSRNQTQGQEEPAQQACQSQSETRAGRQDRGYKK